MGNASSTSARIFLNVVIIFCFFLKKVNCKNIILSLFTPNSSAFFLWVYFTLFIGKQHTKHDHFKLFLINLECPSHMESYRKYSAFLWDDCLSLPQSNIFLYGFYILPFCLELKNQQTIWFHLFFPCLVNNV